MLRSDYHVHFYGADMTYKSDYRIGLRLISDYSTCQAESLVKACDKASRCRWCGEKLNLIKAFFSTMKTALSIIRFMKLSIVKAPTSVLEKAFDLRGMRVTYAAPYRNSRNILALKELHDILSARKYFRSFIHSSIVAALTVTSIYCLGLVVTVACDYEADVYTLVGDSIFAITLCLYFHDLALYSKL